jgi:hypothetical protein
MKKMFKLTSIRSTVIAFGAMAASVVSAGAQSATATISGVQSGSVFDYTVTLDNTGTAPLESFWYAWTQSGNNLTADPSNLGNSLGWNSALFNGTSIQYTGTAGDALAGGQSATFTFASTETPTEITTPPQGESVAYEGGIDFSQGVTGDSTVVFSPSLVAVPESTSPALLAVGCLGVIMMMRKHSGKSPVSN